MAKVYQPMKNNKYYLPKNLYMRTVYLIRDYTRLQEEYEDMLGESFSGEGAGGSTVSDPTPARAAKVYECARCIRAIAEALLILPEEYRNGVLENIVSGERYPDYAAASTWSRNRSRFIYEVARNMNWISK